MSEEDELLAVTDIEEAYSLGYAGAVAAGAGYVVATRTFDRDGVDITIESGRDFRPKLDVQLKSTVNLKEKGGVLKYPLKKRNYDLLRIQTQTPRILVVLQLPPQESDWMSITPTELALRSCAYWKSLIAEPEMPDNKTSVTVDLDSKNRFDVAALKMLMDLSRQGKPI